MIATLWAHVAPAAFFVHYRRLPKGHDVAALPPVLAQGCVACGLEGGPDPRPAWVSAQRPVKGRSCGDMNSDFTHDAVCAAYGWKSVLSDEEILEKLLALNLERSKAEVV